MKFLLAYVPVPHEGYRQLFVRDPLVRTLYIFGSDLIEKYDPFWKDIRCLAPHLVREAIRSWKIFSDVQVVDEAFLEQLNRDACEIVMPEDDVHREVAETYLRHCKVEFASIFLRWDRGRVLAENPVPSDALIVADEFASKVFGIAFREAAKSPDWWRQIGAVLIRNSEIIMTAFNQHVPSNNFVWAFGDPRSNFKKGVHFELSPALHAEVAIIAEAARTGLSLEGCDLYVTIFPCPPCAKPLAYSGIKRIFFLEGYSVYDAADILRARGVEIIRVKM